MHPQPTRRATTPRLALLSHPLQIHHPERLLHALHEVPPAPARVHDPAALEEAVHVAARVRHAAEEHAHVAGAVRLHDFAEDLRARAVERGDAVHVEDDVLVVLAAPDAGEGRVRGRGAVVFQAGQAGPQVACVGEGEGLGDLDDQAPFDELQAVGVEFGVGELVGRARHAA